MLLREMPPTLPNMAKFPELYPLNQVSKRGGGFVSFGPPWRITPSSPWVNRPSPKNWPLPMARLANYIHRCRLIKSTEPRGSQPFSLPLCSTQTGGLQD